MQGEDKSVLALLAELDDISKADVILLPSYTEQEVINVINDLHKYNRSHIKKIIFGGRVTVGIANALDHLLGRNRTIEEISFNQNTINSDEVANILLSIMQKDGSRSFNIAQGLENSVSDSVKVQVYEIDLKNKQEMGKKRQKEASDVMQKWVAEIVSQQKSNNRELDQMRVMVDRLSSDVRKLSSGYVQEVTSDPMKVEDRSWMTKMQERLYEVEKSMKYWRVVDIDRTDVQGGEEGLQQNYPSDPPMVSGVTRSGEIPPSGRQGFRRSHTLASCHTSHERHALTLAKKTEQQEIRQVFKKRNLNNSQQLYEFVANVVNKAVDTTKANVSGFYNILEGYDLPADELLSEVIGNFHVKSMVEAIGSIGLAGLESIPVAGIAPKMVNALHKVYKKHSEGVLKQANEAAAEIFYETFAEIENGLSYQAIRTNAFMLVRTVLDALPAEKINEYLSGKGTEYKKFRGFIEEKVSSLFFQTIFELGRELAESRDMESTISLEDCYEKMKSLIGGLDKGSITKELAEFSSSPVKQLKRQLNEFKKQSDEYDVEGSRKKSRWSDCFTGGSVRKEDSSMSLM